MREREKEGSQEPEEEEQRRLIKRRRPLAKQCRKEMGP